MIPVKDFNVSGNMSADEIVRQMYDSGGFTAKKVGEGLDILENMVKDGYKISLSFPACIVATGTRGVIKEMVKRGMVQTLGLYVNGHFAGYERLPGRGFRSVPFLVPAADLRIGDNLFTLRAGFRRRAGGRDRRRVAVAVDRIVVVPLDRISAEEAVALASLAAEGGSRPRTSE